ncbi:hypothetical protein TNCV_967051 [Trichonephila clavipes]|nr:hypothetical protein TNCV_967051 [Trichonephila clavipes]
MPDYNVVKKGTAIQSHWDLVAWKTKAEKGKFSGIRLTDYKRKYLENKNIAQSTKYWSSKSTSCLPSRFVCQKFPSADRSSEVITSPTGDDVPNVAVPFSFTDQGIPFND